MAGDLSALQGLAAILAVIVGGTVQGTVGFGFGLIAAPTLALVRPEALPASLLFLGLPLSAYMTLHERSAIDVGGFARMSAGRALGTGLGVALLVAVPADSLSVLFGAVILAVAAASLGSRPPRLRRRPRFAAGLVSGITGATAAVGGPPLALVYQDRPGPELRATLASVLLLGVVLALVALGLAGEIGRWQAVLALELLPALAVGVALGTITARRLDPRWLRPAVLAFSGLSGAGAILKGLLG